MTERKPCAGWIGNVINSGYKGWRDDQKAPIASHELDVDGFHRCHVCSLRNGRHQWSVFVKGDYDDTTIASGGVEGAESLEAAQLACEDALRALLTSALAELGPATAVAPAKEET